jgi:hypothetical protein
MNVPLPKISRGLITVMAAAFLAVISQAGYREFRERAKLSDQDETASLMTRRMMEAAGQSDPDLLRRFEEDEASKRPTWNRYLTQKYAPLGAWTRGVPLVLMGVEFVLAAAGAVVAQTIVRQARRESESTGVPSNPIPDVTADS